MLVRDLGHLGGIISLLGDLEYLDIIISQGFHTTGRFEKRKPNEVVLMLVLFLTVTGCKPKSYFFKDVSASTSPQSFARIKCSIGKDFECMTGWVHFM